MVALTLSSVGFDTSWRMATTWSSISLIAHVIVRSVRHEACAIQLGQLETNYM